MAFFATFLARTGHDVKVTDKSEKQEIMSLLPRNDFDLNCIWYKGVDYAAGFERCQGNASYDVEIEYDDHTGVTEGERGIIFSGPEAVTITEHAEAAEQSGSLLVVCEVPDIPAVRRFLSSYGYEDLSSSALFIKYSKKDKLTFLKFEYEGEMVVPQLSNECIKLMNYIKYRFLTEGGAQC